MDKPDPVDLWLNQLAYERSGSKWTARDYRSIWNQFITFAGTTAEEILADYEASDDRTFKRKWAKKIRSWVMALEEPKPNKETLTSKTISTKVGSVKSFFRYNDLPLGHISTAQHFVTYYDRDISKYEINAIMAQCAIREKAFFAVMAQSGLRPNTIGQLRIEYLENILDPNTPIPCKINVPQEIEKRKLSRHPSFILEEAVKYTKQYLATRRNLKPESFLFASYWDETRAIDRKFASAKFRRAARKLQKSGVISYKVRWGKPSELRLYSLRKYFRKYANRMGFEHVNYLMGHRTPGEDGCYGPKDDEFYRELYESNAMPYLKFEEAPTTETYSLRKQHQEELEDMLSKYKAENDALNARIDTMDKEIEELRKQKEASSDPSRTIFSNDGNPEEIRVKMGIKVYRAQNRVVLAQKKLYGKLSKIFVSDVGELVDSLQDIYFAV